MSRFFRHVLVPAAAPVLFFAIALTPVEVFGCFMRGLLAVIVSIISGCFALYAAVVLVKLRFRGDPNALWWLISALILIIPVVALIIMA